MYKNINYKITNWKFEKRDRNTRRVNMLTWIFNNKMMYFVLDWPAWNWQTGKFLLRFGFLTQKILENKVSNTLWKKFALKLQYRYWKILWINNLWKFKHVYVGNSKWGYLKKILVTVSYCSSVVEIYFPCDRFVKVLYIESIFFFFFYVILHISYTFV